MGTRGAFGIRINGADKVTYCHFDSYPSGLGRSVVDWLAGIIKRDSVGKLKRDADKLRVIDGKTPPTSVEQATLSKYADTGVSRQSTDDWYCLLRRTQGDPAAILKAGVMLDGADFLRDSLFCGYAYIVNLDSMKLEVYQGFQDKKHDRGRYAELRGKSKGYQPVAMVGELDLATIAKWKSTWEADLFPEEE
jgi:hypothetical protein